MRLLRSGAIYAAANIASAAVPFLLLPLLTRVLGPAQYGSVVAFMLLVTLCQALAGFSVNAALGVECFKRKPEALAGLTGSALALAGLSTAACAALVAAVLWLAPGVGGGITPAWGALAALTAGANIVLQCRLVLWQARHRALSSAALQSATSVVNVALSLLAVLVFGWGGEGRNAGIVAAYVLAGVASIVLLLQGSELRWTARREDVRVLLRFGTPLIAHALAGALLATADRWIVAVRLDAAALGVYGAAAQLGMVMAMLADAFVKAFTPWLYGQLRSAAPEARRVALGAVLAAIPAFLLLALLMGVVLEATSGWLLGPRYLQAASVLPWFMLGGAFGGIYMCSAALLFYEVRTARLAGTTLSAALAGAALTWLLVQTFGLAGAAAGYAATQALLAALALFSARHHCQLPWTEPLPALRAWWATVARGGSSRPGPQAELPGAGPEPRNTTP